jgi:hypothetical protein
MSPSLTHGQQISLRYHLTDYPKLAQFEEILEMMEDDVNTVTIWCVFEDMDIATLTTHIRALARDIDRAIEDSRNSNRG